MTVVSAASFHENACAERARIGRMKMAAMGIVHMRTSLPVIINLPVVMT